VLVLTAGWSWAACTPLVFWLTRRLAPERVGVARAVAGHAGAWLVLSAVNTLVRAAVVRHLLAPDVPRLAVIYVYNLDANLIAYVTLVGVGRALALRDEYTRRAARTLALHTEVARARLQFLQRQLRPHFLFNALTAVAELARDAPAAAERTLGCLARLLRAAVAHEGEPEVTLREELETLEPFVEVQRIRFGGALAVTIDVPAGARDALVPSLALQPLVENAVRHGLSATHGRGHVHVAARLRGDRLVVSVRDNGRPRDETAPGETGRRERRVRRARPAPRRRAGEHAQPPRPALRPAQALTLAPAPGGGTVATFDIPLRHAGDPLPIAAEPGRPRGAGPAERGEAWWRRLRAGLARRTRGRPRRPRGRRERRERRQPGAERRGDGALLLHHRGVARPRRARRPAAHLARRGGVRRGVGGRRRLLDAAGQLFDWLLYGRLDAWRCTCRTSSPRCSGPCSRRSSSPSPAPGASGANGWLGRSPCTWWRALVVDVVHIATVVRLALPDRSLLHPANSVQLALNLLIYFALLAWSHGRDFAAWYRERELMAARLEAALAHARWRSLALAVRPTFLLAVLARAAELVRGDPGRAERVIERLADVLRATLDATTRQRAATVDEELALLEASLALYHETAGAPAHLVAHVDAAARAEPAPAALFRALVDAVTSLDEAGTGGRAARPVRVAVRTEGGGLATQLVVETIPPLFGTPVPGADTRTGAPPYCPCRSPPRDRRTRAPRRRPSADRPPRGRRRSPPWSRR
jgi:two-component system sensor histidine kinase AlgZ